ncbi:MAG: cysteine hydrolase family protein [Bacilli bacterium]
MKKLLIVVDYQNDFVDGSLGFESASSIETNIINRIKEFEEEKNDIIFTLDTHEENYLDTIEGKKLPIVHCIKGTKGHEIYGLVNEFSKDHLVIEKETFGSSKLVDYLRKNSYDQIELVGLVSNICVFSNAVICKTIQPNSKIIVWRDSTSSNDLSLQEKSFDVLKNLHIDVL